MMKSVNAGIDKIAWGFWGLWWFLWGDRMGMLVYRLHRQKHPLIEKWSREP